MNINIRLANLIDAHAIAMVQVDSWQATYHGHIADQILNNLSYEKQTRLWNDLLQAGISMWVVEHNKKIIGFASVCPPRDAEDDPSQVLEISAIYLLKEYWQQGIGKQLCQQIFQYARAAKFKEITLWVLESNKQARYFYERLGFYTKGEKKIDHIACESMQVIRYRRQL